MTGKNVLMKIALLFIIVFAMIHYVSALGISPGRTTINFEPGLQKTVQVMVVNNENKNMKVNISVRGYFLDYITTSEDILNFTNEEYIKIFTYSVNLPQSVNESGLKKTDIVASEIAEENTTGTITVLIAVISQLHVYVPADSDGDGIIDSNDACPYAAGPSCNDGCPDSIPPAINQWSPLNNSIIYNINDIYIELNVTDSCKDQVWINDGINNITLESPYQLNYLFPNGTNSIISYANDTSGNIAQLFTSFLIEIDNTPPITQANSFNYTFGNWTDKDIIINLTCEDMNGTGCINTFYCIDTDNTCSPFVIYNNSINVSNEASSYLRFYSVDYANNSEINKFVNVKINKTQILLNITTNISNETIITNTTTNISNENITSNNFGTILGNITDLNTSTFSPSILINNESNLGQIFNGTKTIKILNGNQSVVEFIFNFSNNNTLNLKNITIETNSTDLGGYIFVNLNSQNITGTKTLYVPNTNNLTTFCIKDSDITLISQISSLCNQPDEYSISCPGTANNGAYNCTWTDSSNSTFKITGLTHSGIQQQSFCSDGVVNSGETCSNCPSDAGACPAVVSTTQSSSDGSNGGSGGGYWNDAITYICDKEWSCTSWSQCENSGQSRTCNLVTVQEYSQNTTCPKNSSPLTTSRNCEMPAEKIIVQEEAPKTEQKTNESSKNQSVNVLPTTEKGYNELNNNLNSVSVSNQLITGNVISTITQENPVISASILIAIILFVYTLYLMFQREINKMQILHNN